MLDEDGRPLNLQWNYDRAELIADAVVHILGLTLAMAGTVTMVVLAALYATTAETASVVVYSLALLGLLTVSAAYNMWPISRTKWILRRADHACIYLLIAATYTPFMTRIPLETASIVMFSGVWIVALTGAALKVCLPGRFDRLSIVLCVLLGASGALAWNTMVGTLPTTTAILICTGGSIYVGGVVFHIWDGLRFQNAAWHCCVLVASALFYSAILHGVVLA